MVYFTTHSVPRTREILMNYNRNESKLSWLNPGNILVICLKIVRLVKQCTYNVTERRVRANSVVEENK